MESSKKGGDDANDNPEENNDSKLFVGKKRPNQMHNKGFGAKSFAKKR